nr:phage/plasmid primase, P4 family [uncultured Desulfobacter sp.]
MMDIEEIKDKVDQRIKKADTGADVSRQDCIDSDFIHKCLMNNEFGDGEMFKRMYRADFVYNKATDCWFRWAGHHWVIDKMDDTLASVEGVAMVYQTEIKRLSKEISNLEAQNKAAGSLKSLRDLYKKRVKDLKSKNRRANCLFFAHTSKNPMAIDGSEVDQKPWLLPCSNGVVNLKTGDIEPGRPKDYLLKASPVAFPEDGIFSDMSVWEGVLLEIFDNRQDLVDFFRQICGSSMVGEVMQAVFIVMTGRGANGKSMIVKAITDILGPLAGSIRSEMLLDQNRVASSAGPTPDIMALRGLRMAFASETDDGCKISSSRVKWLTGADTITGRNPHDKYEVSFQPTHTLMLLTNHKPHASADDFAFWRRMIVLPFDVSFIVRQSPDQELAKHERDADSNLSKKLEAVYPSILAWFVKGCIEWQKAGYKLIQPAAVKAAVAAYQKDEDSVGDFIHECCIVGEGYHVTAAAVYERFEVWWKKNVSNRIPKKKRFGQWFSARFEKAKSGTIKYIGVGLRDDLEDYG